MVIFNSYVKLPEGNPIHVFWGCLHLWSQTVADWNVARTSPKSMGDFPWPFFDCWKSSGVSWGGRKKSENLAICGDCGGHEMLKGGAQMFVTPSVKTKNLQFYWLQHCLATNWQWAVKPIGKTNWYGWWLGGQCYPIFCKVVSQTVGEEGCLILWAKNLARTVGVMFSDSCQIKPLGLKMAHSVTHSGPTNMI
jgi:hypothetical protein